MKKLFLVALVLFAHAALFAQTKWNVDVVHSSVKFTVEHLVISEVEGMFKTFHGSMTSSNPDFTGSTVEFTVDVNSISTDNEMRDTHLKSDDFFGVATYPTAELVLTKVEGTNFSGNLTIKGITNPVSFTATSSKDGKSTVYKGTLTIDRSKYNVKYGSKSFFDNLGDKVINDEFTLDFNLVVAE